MSLTHIDEVLKYKRLPTIPYKTFRNGKKFASKNKKASQILLGSIAKKGVTESICGGSCGRYFSPLKYGRFAAERSLMGPGRL